MTRQSALRYTLWSAALMGLGLMPTTSQASISFQMTSPGSVQTETNLGDFVVIDANTVQALNLNSNNTIGQDVPVLQIDTYASKGGADVAIQVGHDNNPQGQGQAYLEAVSAPIGYGVFTAIDPPFQGFSVLEFNPYSTGPNGTFYLVATDQYGNTFNSFILNNGYFTFDAHGQNRVAAIGHHGQIITKLEFFVEPATAEILKQFRVTGQIATVPEPASFATAGLGVLMGLGYAWRRRKRAAA